MALFGGSKSTSLSETTTQNAGFSDLTSSTAVNLQGDSNTVTVTDQGAVKSAFDFASGVTMESGKLLRDMSSATAQTVSESIKSVTEAGRTESENLIANIQKFAIYGIAAWAVVKIATSSGVFKK